MKSHKKKKNRNIPPPTEMPETDAEESLLRWGRFFKRAAKHEQFLRDSGMWDEYFKRRERSAEQKIKVKVIFKKKKKK